MGAQCVADTPEMLSQPRCKTRKGEGSDLWHPTFPPFLLMRTDRGGQAIRLGVPHFYLQAAAPAAPQSVRNVPRIVCAKVERGPKLRRSVAAASEDVPPALCETRVNSAGWPGATCPVVRPGSVSPSLQATGK